MFWKIILAIVGVVLMAVPPTAGADTEAYLDSVLRQYQEKMKIRKNLTPIEIKASLIPRPEGYENPKNWTTEAALRLLYLIAANKTATSLQQTLKEKLASSLVAGNSEVKLRGTEDDLIKIENHMKAELPGSKIALSTFIDLLQPNRILDLVTPSWSRSSEEEDHSEVGDRGYSWSGGRPSGSSGGGSAGGWGGWGGGGSSGWGGWGSGGSKGGRPSRPGGSGKGGPGRPGSSGSHSPGGYHYNYHNKGNHNTGQQSGSKPARPSRFKIGFRKSNK